MAKAINKWDVIRRPIITEKAQLVADAHNQYTFEVHVDANKLQIRDAVEDIFDVDVMNVHTIVMPPKRARRGRRFFIRKKKWKKAIVTVKANQRINLFEQ